MWSITIIDEKCTFFKLKPWISWWIYFYTTLIHNILITLYINLNGSLMQVVMWLIHGCDLLPRDDKRDGRFACGSPGRNGTSGCFCTGLSDDGRFRCRYYRTRKNLLWDLCFPIFDSCISENCYNKIHVNAQTVTWFLVSSRRFD